jgi:hypothetical protein
MKKLLLAMSIMAIAFSSCRKTEEKDKSLSEYIIGDWNMHSIALSGNIESPFFSGPVSGTGSEVSGGWNFRENGTFRGRMKYKMTITVSGIPLGTEDEDEVIEGTYSVSGDDSISLTSDGETVNYKIRKRENSSFELTFSEVFDDMGATGNLNFVVGMRR